MAGSTQGPPCPVCEAGVSLDMLLSHVMHCLVIPVTLDLGVRDDSEPRPLQLAEEIEFHPTSFRLAVCGEPLWLTSIW